ncbi:hypothetical protein FRC17_002957 [Serendipita sp. 399]|nr:hypothetical protein FRC17_002957 [Serendipita sp. 399]
MSSRIAITKAVPQDHRAQQLTVRLEQVSESKSSSSCPISTIPNEILGAIFQEVVAQDPNTDCMLLAGVCRLWKDVVLSDSKLWSRLHISNMANLIAPTTYNLGEQIGTVWIDDGYQMCFNHEALDAALRRAGKTLLSIRISAYPSEAISGEFKGMWDLVLRQPISDRIRKLCLWSFENPDLVIPPLSIYPVLTHLELVPGVVQSESLTVDILSATRTLKHLHVHNSVRCEVALRTHWSGLEYLAAEVNIDADIFNLFCDQLQNLRRVAGAPHYWPNESTPDSKFNHLVSLELYCYHQYLPCLSLPSLQELTLDIDDADPYLELGPNHFPARSWTLPTLSKLTLRIALIIAFPTWFSSTSMPKLQELVMVLHEDSPVDFPSTTFTNLRYLSIDANRPDLFWIEVLESCPNLKTTNICMINDGVVLLRRLSVTGLGTLCPELSSVSLECESDRQVLEPSIQGVLVQRRSCLDKIVVIWWEEDTKSVSTYI